MENAIPNDPTAHRNPVRKFHPALGLLSKGEKARGLGKGAETREFRREMGEEGVERRKGRSRKEEEARGRNREEKGRKGEKRGEGVETMYCS